MTVHQWRAGKIDKPRHMRLIYHLFFRIINAPAVQNRCQNIYFVDNLILNKYYINLKFNYLNTLLNILRKHVIPTPKQVAPVFCIFFSSLALGQAPVQEKVITIDNPVNRTLIRINMPASQTAKKTLLIFYALPNGNSIEWTMGKITGQGDDWHFDIQHIAAQTRYLRQLIKNRNVVVVYLANQLKSWPAWKKQQPDGPGEIRRIVDSISGMFASSRLEVMLNSHSGGGSFIFGYLDAVDPIPSQVNRIGFIDSDYGYEDSLHGAKLVQWLKASKKHSLYVLSYNDSVVIYNGKPLVSATGGTWWRSQRMQQRLSAEIPFTKVADTAFINYYALNHRIAILLKTNPEGKIYHTEQVARNGFIHTVLGGTKWEKKAGYVYWGDRVYSPFITRD